MKTAGKPVAILMEQKLLILLALLTGGRLTENQLIEIVFYQLIKIFIIS
jgi:hypothetical protein